VKGDHHRALVTVAATFNNEAQIVVPGEVDGGNNILGLSGDDSVSTRCRSPTPEPARGLRSARLFPDEIRVPHFLDARGAFRTAWRVLAWSKR
jgi:hypothetical protein